MIEEIIEKLTKKNDLESDEINFVFASMMKGELPDSECKGFLLALNEKEPSPEEIYQASSVLIDNLGYKSSQGHNLDLIDLCGTGGDSKSSINVSTISSLILAALGVKVAKHGNRSVSSKVGSADLIEAFGINFDDSIEGSIESIKDRNLSFLYAPNFHKSMKHVAHIRKELKTRTIFNILGPLVNPLRPKKQLLGVYDKRLMVPVANALIKQGSERALVVHGADGMDEISNCAITYIVEVDNGKIKEYEISPNDLGYSNIGEGSNSVIDSVEQSKKAALRILSGNLHPDNTSDSDTDSDRIIIQMNAGAALYIYGQADSIEEGCKIVEASLSSGEIKKKLSEIINF
ncbi:MAG: anthranilate phosphoribosyltransferase [Thermodesulfobacteriota bacterium]|nr:anthranilate phosphoribosyltransferase [Thermodesulfobacteriota bacterium]